MLIEGTTAQSLESFISTALRSHPKQQKGIRLPILGHVTAGIPVKITKPSKFFGLRITRHSMEPRICDSDVVTNSSIRRNNHRIEQR